MVMKDESMVENATDVCVTDVSCRIPLCVSVGVFTIASAAILVNVFYILSVKPPKKPANASDALQWLKTTIALMTLLTVVPLHVVAFRGPLPDFCTMLATVLLEHLLVDLYPLALLALAITRMRICMCKGNADVLITKISAILTFALCFLPLGISCVLLAFIISTTSEIRSPVLLSYCMCTGVDKASILQSFYFLFTVIAFDILPIVFTMIIYGGIHIWYRKTENQFQKRHSVAFVRQRKMTIVHNSSKSGRSIGHSIGILSCSNLIGWVPYVTLKLLTWYGSLPFGASIHHTVSVFSIVILCLCAPVGDGMFFAQKRENFSEFWKMIFISAYSRFRVRATQERVNEEQHDFTVARHEFNISNSTESVFKLDNDEDVGTYNTNASLKKNHRGEVSSIMVERVRKNTRLGKKRRRVCFSSDAEPEDIHCKQKMRVSSICNFIQPSFERNSFTVQVPDYEDGLTHGPCADPGDEREHPLVPARNPGLNSPIHSPAEISESSLWFPYGDPGMPRFCPGSPSQEENHHQAVLPQGYKLDQGRQCSSTNRYMGHLQCRKPDDMVNKGSRQPQLKTRETGILLPLVSQTSIVRKASYLNRVMSPTLPERSPEILQVYPELYATHQRRTDNKRLRSSSLPPTAFNLPISPLYRPPCPSQAVASGLSPDPRDLSRNLTQVLQDTKRIRHDAVPAFYSQSPQAKVLHREMPSFEPDFDIHVDSGGGYSNEDPCPIFVLPNQRIEENVPEEDGPPFLHHVEPADADSARQLSTSPCPLTAKSTVTIGQEDISGLMANEMVQYTDPEFPHYFFTG